MAEIGHGYGSEFQLLRFLGHHRNEFESIIRDNSRFKRNFSWLDFPYENQRISLDGEYKGISFLKDHYNNYSDLEAMWKSFWPSSGNQQNWDAIFIHEDEFVLIEAKAHLKEIESECKAESEDSKKLIYSSLEKTKAHFGIKTENDWAKKYYQTANRLAFIKFLINNNIKAHLLNVYFINGYIKRCPNKPIEDKSVQTEEIWREAIKKQYNYLGIVGSMAENYITSIFVNCLPLHT